MNFISTKGLQSGMKSKKRLQCIEHPNFTKSSSKKNGHYTDVKNELLQKLCPQKGYRDRLGDSFRRENVCSRQWRFVTFDAVPSLNHKKRRLFASQAKFWIFRPPMAL